MDKTVINLRLAELRRAKYITQTELSEKIWITFQTISKWENGITMLPVPADYFDISVDELLGLKLLKGDVYLSEETDSEDFWDKHSEYIMRSRAESWNDDYLEFLIREVWKIESKVSILDCGCVYGYFAPMLMKHLPVGSSYTGVDFSQAMTEQAQRLINNHNISGRIIKCDFFQSDFKGMFDIVICRSVLRYIGNSRAFISKMAEAAIRKVFEETKVKIAPAGMIALRWRSNKWYLVFKANYVDGVPEADPSENSDAVFMDIVEALANPIVTDTAKSLIHAAAANKIIPSVDCRKNRVLYSVDNIE